MAAQKQPKAELIAIYRLEFYKKQQNWKLAKDARKTPDTDSVPATPVKNTRILNETYNIDTDEDNVHNTLNDAFINDDSDKNAPTLHISHSGLQTQSLEPIHACQVCQQRDSQPESPWADYVDDRDPGDWVEGLKCGGDNEFEGYDGRWIDGMVWTNSGLPQAWAGEMPAEVNFLQGANCPENVIWSADNILCSQLTPWPDDQLWVPEIWGDDKLLGQSLESVEDFLIGAHSAPHSSEIELCLTSELDTNVNMKPSSLSELLRQAGHTRKYRSTLSLNICTANHFEVTPRTLTDSYDTFPTRDVDPPGGTDPLNTLHTHMDRVVSGSYRNVFVGRGRGRLPDEGEGVGRGYRV